MLDGDFIEGLLADADIDRTSAGVVLVSRSLTEANAPSGITVLDDVNTADDLATDLKADVVAVVGQLESMDQADARHLLARLRDVHARRVVVWLETDCWSNADLRALGYLNKKRPSGDGRLFVYDPDLFNEPREWNNASDWANPENFGKYRW